MAISSTARTNFAVENLFDIDKAPGGVGEVGFVCSVAGLIHGSEELYSRRPTIVRLRCKNRSPCYAVPFIHQKKCRVFQLP